MIRAQVQLSDDQARGVILIYPTRGLETESRLALPGAFWVPSSPPRNFGPTCRSAEPTSQTLQKDKGCGSAEGFEPAGYRLRGAPKVRRPSDGS